MGYLSQQDFVLLINPSFLLLLESGILVQLDGRYLRQLGIAILNVLDSPNAVLELSVRREDLLEDLILSPLSLIEASSRVRCDQVVRVRLFLE